jgi:uncharacterized protein YcbK (DUF882 family)
VTGLIGSLVGAASTAVERLAGSVTARGESAGQGQTPQFASVLASVAGSGPARSKAAGSAAGAGASEEAAEAESAEGEAEAATAEGAAAAVEAASLANPAAVEAAASVDVRRVDRSLDGLQPEFRKRLDRVMERMESEFGHSVTVVEAHRTQARQNFLYEQGRSRPGNVVTWTRNSNHTTGRAVDVMIDGTYNNALGYQRLAKIAGEEGLNTLGPRDPGHVELPRNVPGGAPDPYFAAAAPGSETADEMGSWQQVGGLARVAEVAQVAQVGQVADVARVAEVARVADPMRAGQLQGTPVQSPIDASAAAALAARSTQQQNGGSGGGNGKGESGSDSRLPSSAEMELLRGDPGFGRSFASTLAGEAQMTSGSDAVQRAAQILAMKESAANAPVNHLLLRLDGANGGEDRIRVDLRGGTIDTTLNIQNAAEAERLSSRVGELRQSLERHGLEAEAVRIRTTPVAGSERIEMIRAALATAETEAGRNGGNNNRPGSESSSSRDGWQEAQERRDNPGHSRNRSRREQSKEGTA